jgi:hypothetical protein
MATKEDYFLNTPSSTVMLETIEISHPSFSTVYRLVRNHASGITAVTEEAGNPTRTFEYYPFNIEISTSTDDLDYTLKITLGDLGELLPAELDNVFSAGTINTQPTLIYRAYQWTKTTASPIPLANQIIYGEPLEIKALAFNREGCAFEASPVLTNSTSVGIRYTADVFEGLRGFI